MSDVAGASPLEVRSLLEPFPPPSSESSLAVARKGFRPFFLLAGAFAVVALLLWMLILLGRANPGAYFDPIGWHAHEMIFGFAVAVIAGFLLTAVSNWTKQETLVGVPLLALSALWCAGRVALFAPELLPRWGPAALDLPFLPVLAAVVAVPLLRTGNYRNLVFVAILLGLWLTNVMMHLDALGVWAGARRPASVVSVDLVVLVILVFAGRVVPMFTRNATGVQSVRSVPRLDALAAGAMGLVVVLDVAGVSGPVGAASAGTAAALALVRTLHWGARHALRTPLLWILHAGYLFIPLGLGLRACSALFVAVPAVVALHALTVGAIGSVTLGMMARVALGHTGRPLAVRRPVVASFGLILAAASARALLPLTGLVSYQSAVLLAGGLWMLAFGIFVAIYGPILLGPRADGKAG